MKKIILLFKTILLLPVRLFSKISVFVLIKESFIDPMAAVQFGCKIYGSKIGRYSYIAKNCTIVNTTIGNFCSIANNVIINPGKHPISFVSTSPVFYSKKNILGKCFNQSDFKEYDETYVGNDVWIGAYAFVKGGITIGDGAIIGAYTVVTKNVEPYSIMVGNPAREIRKRFDSKTIIKLLEIKWWNQPDSVLKKSAIDINNVEKFINSNEFPS